MKKSLLTLSAVLAATGLFAQRTISVGAAKADVKAPQVVASDDINNTASGSEAVVWTEDFANGFSSTNGTWTTSGQNSNLVQYDLDGPDSLLQFGWGPLPSPTDTNGFVTFDFYNRAGNPWSFAANAAEGYLTSPVIDLTGHPNVEIEFYQQLYWCCEIGWNAELLVSTDGGTTFPTSINVTPANRNERHWTMGLGYRFAYDLSNAIAADPSNVVLRFAWDGTNSDQNGQFTNAYFWMIDDLEIRDLPVNELRFSNLLFTDGSTAAREVRVINNPSGSKWYPSYGTYPIDQVVPMAFGANVINYGSATQYNTQLEVEISKNGSVVGTTVSPSFDLASKEEVGLDTLITNAWTPTDTGTYQITWNLTSDSIAAGNGPTRSESFLVTGEGFRGYQYGVDWGSNDNYIGTDNSVLSLATAYCFPNEDADSAGYVGVESLSAYFSPETDAAGTVLLSVYDTAGVDIPGSGPSSANVIYSNAFTLDASAKQGWFEFNLGSPNANDPMIMDPLVLQSNKCYYFAVSFLTSDADSVIEIANDQTIEADGSIDRSPYGVIMEFSDNTWYTGFSNSLTVNAPIMRLNIFDMEVFSAEDYAKQNALSVYPNPTVDGQVKLDIDLGGQYTIQVMSITGQIVHSEEVSLNGAETLVRDFSSLAKGNYIVKLQGNDFQSTEKLTIK